MSENHVENYLNIKYIEKAEEYKIKDQEADKNGEEYKDLNIATVYLKYQEDLFDEPNTLGIKEIEDEDKRKEIKESLINFLITAFSVRYKKYLQNFENTVSHILITIRKQEEFYVSDILFIFKNKHISESLYILLEDLVWLKTKDCNLIIPLETLEDDNTKAIEHYRIDADKIMNTIDKSMNFNIEKSKLDKFIDYYNLYLTPEEEKSYDSLFEDNITIGEYGTLLYGELFDIIITLDNELLDENVDYNCDLYGPYILDELKDWAFDIMTIFKDEINNMINKK